MVKNIIQQQLDDLLKKIQNVYTWIIKTNKTSCMLTEFYKLFFEIHLY